MRTLALALVTSLLLVRGEARHAAATVPAAPVAVAPPAEEAAAPAPAPLPPLPEAAPLRETGAAPADVVAKVRRAKGTDGWQVQLARKGHLVAMRHGAARTAHADEATLALAEDDAEPVVWETSRLDTLATVRGTLRLTSASTPQASLRLVEAPVPAGQQAGKLHACTAHEDGAGGFTVLCRVRAGATAANVTGEEAGSDVWVAPGNGATIARLDLPVSAAGFEARVLGYSAGVDGVVLRAEASRAAGEERPVLTLAASERAQPQIPRRVIREYRCCFGRFDL